MFKLSTEIYVEGKYVHPGNELRDQSMNKSKECNITDPLIHMRSLVDSSLSINL